ncbi:MAG: hypothetical protein IJ189_00375 [Clostridia bacterium]|nr:hypothetical protein [Clostridia bacterium]
MRIKTPLTPENIKHHFTYSSWKYVLLVVAAVMGWSIIYTTTAYRSPQEKRIDVYVQSPTTSNEILDAFLKPIWEKATPEMETVEGVTLSLVDDYYTTMQLATYVFAGEGDIYFLAEQYFKGLASQGAFLPLEDYVEDGTIDMEGIDLSKGYVTVVEAYDENDVPLSTAQHLYGIPLDSFYGFMNGMQIDNRGMYAAILTNNQNEDNVIPFFDALMQAGRGEKENWITE